MVAFVLFVLFISIFIESQQNIREETTRLKKYQRESPNPNVQRAITNIDDKSDFVWLLLPSFAFLGLMIGLVVFYIMSEKESKKSKVVKINTKKILDLLSSEERLIINKLLENNGKVRQYEITYIDGLTKLKVHRLLKRLEAKDIIKKEKIGKVNNVLLDKEILEILKE